MGIWVPQPWDVFFCSPQTQSGQIVSTSRRAQTSLMMLRKENHRSICSFLDGEWIWYVISYHMLIDTNTLWCMDTNRWWFLMFQQNQQISVVPLGNPVALHAVSFSEILRTKRFGDLLHIGFPSPDCVLLANFKRAEMDRSPSTPQKIGGWSSLRGVNMIQYVWWWGPTINEWVIAPNELQSATTSAKR